MQFSYVLPLNFLRAGRRVRQRVFTYLLALFDRKVDSYLQPYKTRLFRDLAGTVLEIGPGLGANLRYLPRDVHWIGIEPNVFMHRTLLAEAKRLNLTANVQLGMSEDLPFPDCSIDTILATLVLCSVRDQKQTLKEVLRVLKPRGQFLFIEHVAAPLGTRQHILQRICQPIWSQLMDGCQPTRDTMRELAQGGFTNVTTEHFTAPVPIISPHIAGVATKG